VTVRTVKVSRREYLSLVAESWRYADNWVAGIHIDPKTGRLYLFADHPPPEAKLLLFSEVGDFAHQPDSNGLTMLDSEDHDVDIEQICNKIADETLPEILEVFRQEDNINIVLTD
jgi:hypothetical protein